MISFPIVVPVKTFDLAKQRLSGILQPSERAALARSMLIDVLNIVASAISPSNAIVVTSSPEASDIAKSARMLVLHEAACSDLNSAIEAASRHMIVQNAGRSRGTRGAFKLNRLYPRRAALLHKVLLKRQNAVIGIDHG